MQNNQEVKEPTMPKEDEMKKEKKMRTVKLVNFDDLTTDEKLGVSNNGYGKEYASYIVIEDENGKRIYSDAMEPEDATFFRDLSWIIEELK